MEIDRRAFFDAVRGSLFGGRMTAGQVAGTEAILDRCGRMGPPPDRRQVAYVLATAHHETGRRMQPVRETFAASDAAAAARLERAFAAGRLRQVRAPYWRADGEGRHWFGRGLVQITHRDNYDRVGRLLGLDLVSDPAVTLRPDIAVEILVAGMEAGAFTGERLSDHLGGGRGDFVAARRIVNGTDRATRIAGVARAYLAALG